MGLPRLRTEDLALLDKAISLLNPPEAQVRVVEVTTFQVKHACEFDGTCTRTIILGFNTTPSTKALIAFLSCREQSVLARQYSCVGLVIFSFFYRDVTLSLFSLAQESEYSIVRGDVPLDKGRYSLSQKALIVKRKSDAAATAAPVAEMSKLDADKISAATVSTAPTSTKGGMTASAAVVEGARKTGGLDDGITSGSAPPLHLDQSSTIVPSIDATADANLRAANNTCGAEEGREWYELPEIILFWGRNRRQGGNLIVCPNESMDRLIQAYLVCEVVEHSVKRLVECGIGWGFGTVPPRCVFCSLILFLFLSSSHWFMCSSNFFLFSRSRAPSSRPLRFMRGILMSTQGSCSLPSTGRLFRPSLLTPPAKRFLLHSIFPTSTAINEDGR